MAKKKNRQKHKKQPKAARLLEPNLELLAASGNVDAQYGVALSYLEKDKAVDGACNVPTWPMVTLSQLSATVDPKNAAIVARQIRLLKNNQDCYEGSAGILLLCAAIQKHVDAQYRWALYCIDVLKLPQYHPDVLSFFRSAATAQPPNAQAQTVMGEYYLQQAASPSLSAELRVFYTDNVIAYLEEAAADDPQTGKPGDPIAQLKLAECYKMGIGVTQNILKAATLDAAQKSGWDCMRKISRTPAWTAGVSRMMETYLGIFNYKLSDFLSPVISDAPAVQPAPPREISAAVTLIEEKNDVSKPKQEIPVEESEQAALEKARLASEQEKVLQEQSARRAEKEKRKSDKILLEKEKSKIARQLREQENQRMQQEAIEIKQLEKNKKLAEKSIKNREISRKKSEQRKKLEEAAHQESLRLSTLTPENEKIFSDVAAATGENGDKDAKYRLMLHFEGKEDGRVRNKYGAMRLRDELKPKAEQQKYTTEFYLAPFIQPHDTAEQKHEKSPLNSSSLYKQALKNEQDARSARRASDPNKATRLFKLAEDLYESAAAQGEKRAHYKLWLYEMAAYKAAGFFKSTSSPPASTPSPAIKSKL